MQADLLGLVGRERPGPVPGPRMHRDATEVVHEAGAADRRDGRGIEAAVQRRRLHESATPDERPLKLGDDRSAKSPIAASARSIAAPSSCIGGEGSQARTSSHTDPSSSASSSSAPSATSRASSGSNAAPARSRTIRAACSAPPSMRCIAASCATWAIRSGSGIWSRSARPSGPLPSQRSVR